MYELTITTDGTSSTTRHGGPDQARQQLIDHAVHADLYLHGDHAELDATPDVTAAARFHLLRLDPTGRHPRCVGTATIAAAPTHTPILTGVATS
jgi:hypothetical protein